MKKIHLKTLICATLVALMTLVGFGITTFADGTSTAMLVSPMSQKIILVPGEEYQGTLKISNPATSTADLEYSVSVGSFSQSADGESKDDYGAVDIDTVTSYNQIMDWISLDRESGTIAPNETDILVFTISVPYDAPAGGQYATIVVQDDTEHSSSGSNVSIASIPQVASIIYAEVAGETHNEGAITEHNIPSILFDKVLNATSMVYNGGNVHTDAEYTLQVWPIGSDEEICTNEEKTSTSLILPKTEKYHTETCSLPGIGLYRVKQTVKIFNEQSVLEKTVFYCPLWLMFVALFIIIALVIWVVLKVRSRRK